MASRTAFLGALLLSAVALLSPSDGGAGALFPGSDKVGHALLFTVVAGSGRWAGVRPWPLAGSLLGYAVLTEVVQGTVLPHRSGDWRDVLADLAGITLGWIAARLLLRHSLLRRTARPKAATDEGSGLRS